MPYLKKLAQLVLALTTVLTVLTVRADAVPPGTDDEIRARLSAFGKLCRAGEDCGTTSAAVASGGKSGEEVYNQFCFACHATGVSEAPLFGSAEAWAPRVDKGMETLMASTLNGLGLMPPKGTCMTCTDEELEAAVDYMIEQAQ